MKPTLNELLAEYALPASEQHSTDNLEPRRALDAEPGEMYRAAVALANGGDGGAAGQRLALRADGRYRDATTLSQRRERNASSRTAQSLDGRKARGAMRD